MAIQVAAKASAGALVVSGDAIVAGSYHQSESLSWHIMVLFLKDFKGSTQRNHDMYSNSQKDRERSIVTTLGSEFAPLSFFGVAVVINQGVAVVINQLSMFEASLGLAFHLVLRRKSCRGELVESASQLPSQVLVILTLGESAFPDRV